MGGKKSKLKFIQKNMKEMEKWAANAKVAEISTLHQNLEKVIINHTYYYDAKKDNHDCKKYYQHIVKTKKTGKDLFYLHHIHAKAKHIRTIPYFISKDNYLYTWVDLHADGTVKSIYSGQKKNPQTLLLEDFLTVNSRFYEFQTLLNNQRKNGNHIFQKVAVVDKQHKFNTEHVVPQSWFSAREPMKGDLHHLFVCEPHCNAARSNFPYGDHLHYVPESASEKIRNQCGVVINQLFEPEYGKGIVARAMFYFLVRYPRAIRKRFRKSINYPLLREWNRTFPINMYEKHRNQAIYQIQGNRNPFIDFPNLAEQIKFPDE
ncbi:endonuclease I family protein [Bacillus kwashiorkori]|uniref:endonuclease I family protein n=1 Tax=Bacillus kwashiorkori TaxID=1522318 RepID=UPI000A8F1E01|nr:endonuclease [Bacillus kwashiorkori]